MECEERLRYKPINKVINNEQLSTSPEHYRKGGRECVEFIEAALGKEGFQSYCLGNVMKYVWRHDKAGGAKDIRKAKRYLEYWLAAEGMENIKERVNE